MDLLRGNPIDSPQSYIGRFFKVRKRIVKFLEVSSFELDSNGRVHVGAKRPNTANVHSGTEQLSKFTKLLSSKPSMIQVSFANQVLPCFNEFMFINKFKSIFLEVILTLLYFMSQENLLNTTGQNTINCIKQDLTMRIKILKGE